MPHAQLLKGQVGKKRGVKEIRARRGQCSAPRACGARDTRPDSHMALRKGASQVLEDSGADVSQ